jgi:hypothetical protein
VGPATARFTVINKLSAERVARYGGSTWICARVEHHFWLPIRPDVNQHPQRRLDEWFFWEARRAAERGTNEMRNFLIAARSRFRFARCSSEAQGARRGPQAAQELAIVSPRRGSVLRDVP